MSDPVATEIQDGVAVIIINNPPVNALSQEVVDALASAISDAQQNSEVRAVVVAGAGRTFVAGADINGLDALAWGTGPGAPEMHDVFALIEGGVKPVVMALHGTTLGGGLELAMA